jgi:5-methylcytosine-specific restriction enzyme A
MNHPFSIGNSYARADLLEFVGSGQAQSGIIWGSKQPDVVICTTGGKHGDKAGYADTLNSDGTWTYFGQGSSGDQNPGTFANRLLVEGQRSILLFKTAEPTPLEIRQSGNWKKKYSFVGEFCTCSWEYFIPADGLRANASLLKFFFAPIAGDGLHTFESIAVKQDVVALNTKAAIKRELLKRGAAPRKGPARLRDYYVRCELLKEYVKLRADGFCEYCLTGAPFLTEERVPYLEIHHILRLADDGPDEPENAAALCPNCHRRCHSGWDKAEMRSVLTVRIQEKERQQAS